MDQYTVLDKMFSIHFLKLYKIAEAYEVLYDRKSLRPGSLNRKAEQEIAWFMVCK